jgi:DNA polymerase eta
MNWGCLFRSMRGDEAKRVCPGINLVQVPVARGKADLNLYRSAGSEVGSPSYTNLLLLL